MFAYWILLAAPGFLLTVQSDALWKAKHSVDARRLLRFERVEFSRGQEYAPLLLHSSLTGGVYSSSGWISR